jgi:TonB family protein
MRRIRERASDRLLIALAIAVAVHVTLMAPAVQWLFTGVTPPPPEDELEPKPSDTRLVEVQLFPPHQDPAFVTPPKEDVAEAPKPDEPEPVPEDEPEEKPDGQIVEIPPPERQERPEDAELISEYDSKVDKEQVAQANEAPRQRQIKSDRTVPSAGDNEAGTETARRTSGKDQKSKGPEGDAETAGNSKKANDTPGDPTAKATDPQKSTDPEADRPQKADGGGETSPREAAAREERKRLGRGSPYVQGGHAGGPPSIGSILPSLGPEDIARRDGSIDHLPDVDEGAVTALNTRASKYASFFNRVKNSVQEHWHAVDVHRMHDPYGRVYGVRDRITVVSVTLNPDGTLDDIQIEKNSGVAFLDEVALRAFREAQPFPNPPRGLRDPDGRIRFRFGFCLEINGGGMQFRF